MKPKAAQIKDLLGKTLTEVTVAKDDQGNVESIVFRTSCGEKYWMYHDQDCCEYVYLYDVVGDLNALIGSPLLQCEEATSEDDPDDVTSQPKFDKDAYRDASATWTFYKLATIKGYVTLRWLGESNGYYSERVDLVQID